MACVAVICLAFVAGFGTTPAHSQSLTSGGYTTKASASPASVSAGASVTIAVVVTSASASQGLVDVEAYGVVAFLFGRGADGVTCACDASGDGVTNPVSIDGNTGVSVSADDDGGFFREQAASYYQTGAVPLQ
jgi:hypothetical protein